MEDGEPGSGGGGAPEFRSIVLPNCAIDGGTFELPRGTQYPIVALKQIELAWERIVEAHVAGPTKHCL